MITYQLSLTSLFQPFVSVHERVFPLIPGSLEPLLSHLIKSPIENPGRPIQVPPVMAQGHRQSLPSLPRPRPHSSPRAPAPLRPQQGQAPAPHIPALPSHGPCPAGPTRRPTAKPGLSPAPAKLWGCPGALVSCSWWALPGSPRELPDLTVPCQVTPRYLLTHCEDFLQEKFF